MNRQDLITQCNFHLGAATACATLNDHEHYAEHMQRLLVLLVQEVPITAPETPDERNKKRSES